MTEPVLEVNEDRTPVDPAPVMQEELLEEQRPKKPAGGKKKQTKWIKWVVLALVLLVVAFGMYKLLTPAKDESTVVTDTVMYGSITSTVEGSGITKPKNSETITLTTTGTVVDVFVTEGQQVTAGTPLFTVDSEAAKTAVDKSRKDVDGYQKQLDLLYKDIAGLNLSAPFAGKLMETKKFQSGDEIAKGTPVAKLVDDTRFRLKQYYSYAYKGDIKAGQTASISVPSMMSNVTGTVEAVHMVERISAEGSKLFEVELVVNNAGTLTADMVASAVINAGGETIYPYEAGKLEYYRSTDVKSTVSGTVISSNLIDFLSVSAGQTLVTIDGADSENEIFTAEQSLDNAKKELEKAQKNLDNCNAVAPIDGTVIGLAVTPGQEVAANTAVISIADTATVIVDATVDERNISYIKQGMMVDLDQWGTPFTGVVESVSLSSKVENGVASYPMVVSVDNMDGTIMTGSNVTYKLVASENDNCLVLPVQSVKNVQLADGSTGYVVFVQAAKRPDNAVELPTPPTDVPEGFYPIQVEIGISDNYNVEIKSGVEDGTVVFTTVQRQNAYGY